MWIIHRICMETGETMPEHLFVDFKWNAEGPLLWLDRGRTLHLARAYDHVIGDSPMAPGPEGFVQDHPYLTTEREFQRWIHELPRGPGRPRKPRHRAESVRPCAPENAGLHRTFADTAPTPEGIMRFAQRWGLLGMPFSPRIRAERLRDWVVALQLIRTCVEALEAVRGNDAQYFERRIDWGDRRKGQLPTFDVVPTRWLRPRPNLKVAVGPGLVAVPHSISETDLLRPIRNKDALAFGALALAEIVHDQLSKYTRGGLLLADVPRVQSGSVQMRAGLSFEPNNLLGALWLNLASEMEPTREFTRCARKRCGQWFWVGGAGRRAGAEYCSTVCQSRAYDDRRSGTR
jgi:hypothetical protein